MLVGCDVVTVVAWVVPLIVNLAYAEVDVLDLVLSILYAEVSVAAYPVDD